MAVGESGSHEAALAFVVVRVFETQSLFRPVLLQVRQLLAVDGAPAFPVEIHFMSPVLQSICIVNNITKYN